MSDESIQSSGKSSPWSGLLFWGILIAAALIGWGIWAAVHRHDDRPKDPTIVQVWKSSDNPVLDLSGKLQVNYLDRGSSVELQIRSDANPVILVDVNRARKADTAAVSYASRPNKVVCLTHLDHPENVSCGSGLTGASVRIERVGGQIRTTWTIPKAEMQTGGDGADIVIQLFDQYKQSGPYFPAPPFEKVYHLLFGSPVGQAEKRNPLSVLSITSLSFPGTMIGQNSAAQTVTLTNSGDLPLTSIVATISPPVSGPSPFMLTNNCTAQLAANSSCSLNVVFAPTQAGAQTGTLMISDVVNTQQTVSLSGTGLLPPTLSVLPASLTFAAQLVGVPSAPSTLTVTNSGGVDIANVGFAISDQSAGSFSAGATTCGATLAAGSSCSAQVVFTPSASGGAAAILTISSATIGITAVTVPLSGTGQATGLNVKPTQLTFDPQELNKPSADQTVTISNTGGANATGLALAVSGPFSLVQNTCTNSLAAGASCTTGVVFTPASRGAVAGTLTVSSSSVTTPATVALSGTGGLTGAVHADSTTQAQSDSAIDRWLERFVSASQGPLVQALRVFYADTVSPYFGMKSANWEDIERDKEVYFGRFPTIRYTIVGAPQHSTVDNGDRVVEFVIDYFVVRKDGKTSSGRFHDRITLRAIDGSLKAISVEERRIP